MFLAECSEPSEPVSPPKRSGIPTVISTADFIEWVDCLKLGKDYKVERRLNGAVYITHGEVRLVLEIDEDYLRIRVRQWSQEERKLLKPTVAWAERIVWLMVNRTYALSRPQFIVDWLSEDRRAAKRRKAAREVERERLEANGLAVEDEVEEVEPPVKLNLLGPKDPGIRSGKKRKKKVSKKGEDW